MQQIRRHAVTCYDYVAHLTCSPKPRNLECDTQIFCNHLGSDRVIRTMMFFKGVHSELLAGARGVEITRQEQAHGHHITSLKHHITSHITGHDMGHRRIHGVTVVGMSCHAHILPTHRYRGRTYFIPDNDTSRNNECETRHRASELRCTCDT